MCRAHATVRGLLQEMLLGADDTCWVVVDLEAGVEVMSRATPPGPRAGPAPCPAWQRTGDPARGGDRQQGAWGDGEGLDRGVLWTPRTPAQAGGALG